MGGEGVRCTYTGGPGARELASGRHGLPADESLWWIFWSFFLLISLKTNFKRFISRRSLERGRPGPCFAPPVARVAAGAWRASPRFFRTRCFFFSLSFFYLFIKSFENGRWGLGRAGVYVHLSGPPIAAAPSRARVWRRQFAAKSLSLRLFPF